MSVRARFRKSILAGLAWTAVISLTLPARAEDDDYTAEPGNLPYQMFPPLESIQDETFMKTNEELKRENLQEGIQEVGTEVQSTVKTFASEYNINCLGTPCLIQAFPILYNSPGSGFFAGARINLNDIARINPNLFTLDGYLLRSDTRQWLSALWLDLPKIEFLPLGPRLKLRGDYTLSTTNQYYGTGVSSAQNVGKPDSERQYALLEHGFQASLILPITEIGSHHIRLFTTFNSTDFQPSRISTNTPSVLYADNPLGANGGGVSSGAALGFIVDSRDKEVYTRHGWAIETEGELNGPPLGSYTYRRYTFIDRRYYSWGNNTIASRLTVDSLDGQVPFWELSSVGGIDPINEVSSGDSLRAYATGRFHEAFKAIENLDFRVYEPPARIFGQYCEIMWIPLGGDLGRLGQQFAWDVETEFNFLFNKNFLVRTMAGYSPTGFQIHMGFGENY